MLKHGTAHANKAKESIKFFNFLIKEFFIFPNPDTAVYNTSLVPTKRGHPTSTQPGNGFSFSFSNSISCNINNVVLGKAFVATLIFHKKIDLKTT